MKKKLGRCPYDILMQISDDIERLKKGEEIFKSAIRSINKSDATDAIF